MLAGLTTGAAHAAPWVGNFNTSNGTNVHDGVLLNIEGFDVFSQGTAAFFLNNSQLSPIGTTLKVGDIVTTVYQGVVSSFNPGVTAPNLAWSIGSTGTYQLTIAAIFQERVDSLGVIGTAVTADLQPLAQNSRVSVFYDDASLSNSFILDTAGRMVGTGYTDGMLILDGTLSNSAILCRPLPSKTAAAAALRTSLVI